MKTVTTTIWSMEGDWDGEGYEAQIITELEQTFGIPVTFNREFPGHITIARRVDGPLTEFLTEVAHRFKIELAITECSRMNIDGGYDD